jgi:hypothetical protein
MRRRLWRLLINLDSVALAQGRQGGIYLGLVRPGISDSVMGRINGKQAALLKQGCPQLFVRFGRWGG